MTLRQQFPSVVRAADVGASSLAPMLPLTLVATRSIPVSGLLDTGAAVNALPYASGVELGFDWNRETTVVHLTGNLAIADARAVVVSAVVGTLAPVRLAFAWAEVDIVPVILGQVNSKRSHSGETLLLWSRAPWPRPLRVSSWRAMPCRSRSSTLRRSARSSSSSSVAT